MVDNELLRATIKEKGASKCFIARSLGITVQGLGNKLEGKTEFTAEQIFRISKILTLEPMERDRIFFTEKVG